MTARPHHRKLVDQLREWSPAQVAALLQRRPDLARPRPPADIADLAQRAQQRPSVEAAIVAAHLAENRLLQLVVCCRPDVSTDELARALPEGIGLVDIEDPLSSLEASALVWRHGGRVHSSATLRQTMATTLGPPLAQVVKDQTVGYLKAVLEALRSALGDGPFAGHAPDRVIGTGGRPPRKAELIEELESLLLVPGVVDTVLAGASDECAGIATAMAGGRPMMRLDHALYFPGSGRSSYYQDSPSYWLFEHALLLPVGNDYLAVQPREVGVALRGGRPVADLALSSPPLVTAAIEADQVDTAGAARVARTLDRLDDLADLWEREPAKTLKSRGLGATVVKQTAAALETDPEETTRLVEMAHLAGLVDTTTVTRKEKRAWVYESFVGPSAAVAAWRMHPVPRRWRQLAGAWLRAEYRPSASGRKGPDGKLIPVLSAQCAPTAPQLRRQVLDVLATLPPGTATSTDALAAVVYWRRPQLWLGPGVEDPSTPIEWIYAETELLGIAAGGALTTFGRALLAGDGPRAELGLEAALPDPATSFTLQGDLTATVVGALERSVAVELRLLADVESTGAATTLRFSDASLRRAIDAGRDGDAILAFLEAHASKGVPKALAYLVSDVSRRYGHLQVGAAGSFVTSDDPAVLADACSHRRTRKLALRLLAPTVAVSLQSGAKVIEGLRDAGFLPAGDGDHHGGAGGGGEEEASQWVSISARGAVPPTLPPAGAPSPAADLPERFPTRSDPHPIPDLDASTATRLAESILAVPPAGNLPPSAVPGSAPLPLVFPGDEGDTGEDDTDEDDHVPRTIAELLEWAYVNDRALAVALGDGENLAEPMLVAVTIWEPERVVATDLTDGTLVSILNEHIGSASDAGPVEEVANVTLLGTARRGSGRRHRR